MRQIGNFVVLAEVAKYLGVGAGASKGVVLRADY